MKIQKKKKLGWGREGEGSGLGGQGGCDRRIEKFLVKFTKKKFSGGGGGWGGGGFRGDVNEVFVQIPKKKKMFGGGGGGGFRVGGGGSGWGSQDGCERRI